mmetsp:Transcript_18270/g.47742  ORF Transcript_18270/g.47742 Transcript_18270/m.47742 type:complete len:246 (-) Transcript_18270:3022-3759(-)
MPALALSDSENHSATPSNLVSTRHHSEPKKRSSAISPVEPSSWGARSDSQKESIDWFRMRPCPTMKTPFQGGHIIPRRVSSLMDTAAAIAIATSEPSRPANPNWRHHRRRQRPPPPASCGPRQQTVRHCGQCRPESTGPRHRPKRRRRRRTRLPPRWNRRESRRPPRCRPLHGCPPPTAGASAQPRPTQAQSPPRPQRAAPSPDGTWPQRRADAVVWAARHRLRRRPSFRHSATEAPGRRRRQPR